jgi:hypothetical protein
VPIAFKRTAAKLVAPDIPHHLFGMSVLAQIASDDVLGYRLSMAVSAATGLLSQFRHLGLSSRLAARETTD